MRRDNKCLKEYLKEASKIFPYNNMILNSLFSKYSMCNIIELIIQREYDIAKMGLTCIANLKIPS